MMENLKKKTARFFFKFQSVSTLTIRGTYSQFQYTSRNVN